MKQIFSVKKLFLAEKHLLVTAIGIAAALLTASFPAQAQTDNERIGQLEQQVKNLQQKAALPATERVRFNGFLSVAYGSSDNDAGYADYFEDYDLERESRLGLQGTFAITPATEVIMQLVARGNEQWDPTMEWAYVAHKFNNSLKARVGKMRLPLFMYSDSLEVGYSQPWARPPIEVYDAIPFSSYTGVDGFYEWGFTNSSLTLQGFTGQTEKTVVNGDVSTLLDIRDILGSSLTWTDFVWTLRGVYSTSDVVIANADAISATFMGIGFGYNNGAWQVLGEFTSTEVDGPAADSESGYITVARRFNAITPYITYSMLETTDNNERPLSSVQAFTLLTTPGSPFFGNPNILSGSEINNIEREGISVGLRWDALTNIALKFDITRASEFGDTGGGLSGNIAPTVVYDDSTIYTVKLDAVF